MLDTSYWTLALQTPKECGVSNCDGRPIGISLACSQDDYDPDIGIGGNSYILGVSSNSNAYRKNTGFQDSDDNRKADLPLNIATDNLRTDRFLPGDTIHVALWAAIDSFILIDSIYYSILHEVIASDMGEDDNDIFVTETSIDGFVGQNTIIPVGSSLRIKYANGQEVICDFDDLIETKAGNYIRLEKPNVFPAEALDELTNIRFLHLLPLPEMMNNGCLPSQFLALGDSLFITKDYKINSNFKPASSNAPDPPLVGFRTAATLGIANSAWNFLPSFKMQYSGWNLSRTVNQHTIKPCALSTEPKKFKYSMRIARENMFPNEVRPLGWISEYGQTNPEGLELQSAMLEYLVLQDSTPWLSNLTLPFIQAPLDLQIDFSPAFLDPIDEGYTLRTNLIFKPDCQFSLPDSSIQFMKTTFNGCLNGDEMTRADTIRNPIGFFAYTPRFTLITTDSIVNSPTRAFSVEFPLKNALVSPAPYAWVYVDAPSGLVNQLELIQLPQNQSVTGNNGFFGLGQFNGLSTKDFKLIGESLSCSLDSVYIYYGWSCDPIQQISDATCGIDTTLIFLNLERPELELEIHQEPDQITLCEISDWFEFEVYNAKSGYAYELLSTLKLPAGLKIAAGTSQISYPEGSAWVNIPDPMEASSSFYEWQVSDLLPVVAMNGLPGFNVAPQNSFRIRFKVVAECGFVANTPIVYGTTGTEPCGRQANLLNKLGEPLNVVGVTPSYGVQINIQPFGNLADGCGEIQEFEVNMQLLGTPSPTDSVYISLPQGVHILPTTYLPGTNAPAGPLVINIQGFQLPLPILQGGGPVSFRFKVSYDGIAGCSDKIIQVQTRVRTEAFCASLGAPCVVYVATGESIWNINVEHPTLVITSANFMLTNGETQAEVTITNSGDIITHWAEVDFYHDVNANGVVDAGDVLLGGFVQNASGLLLPGESITLEGTVPGLDSQGWCNLLIVLPANDNCLCSDQIFQPEQWQIAHTELKFCALEPVQLGIPGQIGYTYLWQANSGISCLTCPTITFTPDSSISLNTPIELELTEMDGNCIVRHHFLLSFSTVAGITASDQTVCKGQSVSLSAIPTSGDAYLWTGSGIMDPTLATQTILAQINSTYTVTISFANGCTASKSIDIQVLEPDTVVLPGLITCQGVPVNILGNTTETPGTYQLLLSNSQGCDSLVFQSLAILPPIETVESFTFCLGDTLKNVLDTSFTTSGQVCRTYQNLNGCDSVHCAIVTAVDPPDLPVQDTLYVEYGQLITLSGPSGFESYWWIPAPTPPCEDCQEVTYPADSTAYQEYRLQVIDANGCSGELIFRVLVLPPCSPDSLHIPNAFTPNGDGSNDVFRVVPYESSEVISSLEIYNRWGQKVYENFGNSSWDGTIDGQPASSDVYVYIVTIQCGELVGKRVGDVTLLR
jgi:gliding motility-associated-like protein